MNHMWELFLGADIQPIGMLMKKNIDISCNIFPIL